MRRFASLVVLCCALPAWADATLKTPTEEIWEAAYVRSDSGSDVKIGHIHFISAPLDKGTRTTKELRFVIARGAASGEMKADMSTDEDAKGNVLAVSAKIWLGRDRVQTLSGVVEDGKMLSLKSDGEFKNERKFRWDTECVGLGREQTLLRDKSVKPGDTFSYRYFEPQVANYVTVRVAVGKPETVTLPGGLKRELLKAVATPDPLKLPNGNDLRLPPAVFFADPKSYDTIMTQMNVPELGLVTLYRTSKVAALAPNGQVPDLMKRQSIYLNTAVRDLHERASAVYRITVRSDDTIKDLVVSDDRQVIKNAEGKSFELHITAIRKPEKLAKEAPIGDEFTKSNYFINSDDAEVKKLATRAIGTATDPWEKAQKIETFVRNFMKPEDYTEAMAPADHVAKTGKGDCTEYGMLAAAMCRAAGVPSRTAIGLVYVDNLAGKPGFGFHMWTEVYVKGQWLGLDATRAQGSIGPGHIKITDHSWANVISFTPLLPVKGFITANPSIEFVK